MAKTNILLAVFLLLISCGTLSDAKKVIKNEKINTTDEFFVKKRNPLVLPPNYEDVPKPDSKIEKKENEEEKIKKILKAPKNEDVVNSKSQSVEDTILKKIRK